MAPDGLTGPAWLTTSNFKVIMKWNRSTYFATSVGLLADAIGSEGAPQARASNQQVAQGARHAKTPRRAAGGQRMSER